MFDASRELQEFYDSHVRLSADQRATLATARDLNLTRLTSGLEEMGNEKGKKYNGPVEIKNQGSYAMHTLNQSDEYDIDVALIFNKDDLPDDPLQARQRIRDALLKKCTNFAKEPETRTNAVTVWYQDGYHIDFAIFRTWQQFTGLGLTEKMEHASTSWVSRDPMDINNWFAKAVEDKSPKASPLSFTKPPMVAPGQLRRIVRFIKRFSRSRTSYCLPGGMIITALVAETYVSDQNRDDVSLYKTIESLKNRLSWNTRVYNPVNTSAELTGKTEFHNDVKRLKKELDKHFPRLAILHDAKCTAEQARNAWDWIFNHEYWHPVSRKFEDALTKAGGATIGEKRLPFTVSVLCKLTRGRGLWSYSQYKSGGTPLPKGVSLRFEIEKTSCPPPYDTHWLVENEGSEAEEAEQVKWDRYEEKCETSTKYRGRQRMTCRIEKNRQVLAESTFIVNIK